VSQKLATFVARAHIFWLAGRLFTYVMKVSEVADIPPWDCVHALCESFGEYLKRSLHPLEMTMTIAVNFAPSMRICLDFRHLFDCVHRLFGISIDFVGNS
jgi:hypothetical protein